MSKRRKKGQSKRQKGISLPFGTLVHYGEKKVDDVHLSIISYDQKDYISNSEINPDKLDEHIMIPGKVNWININGLHDIPAMEKVGKHLNISNLILEDVLNTDHIPKFEEFENQLFVIFKMISVAENGDIDFEQISLVLGTNYVVSFQEKPGDIFRNLRERLQNPDTLARRSQADYLLIRLIDIVVDHYFFVFDHIGDKIEQLEDRILDGDQENILGEVQSLKKDLIYLRKSVFPLREALSQLQRAESNMIDEKNTQYIADIYDHLIHVIQSLETYRDLLSSLTDMHMSNISYRMNVVMKVLTIIATIFIPLTFIAGIYGMNFEHMPELGWKYSYPVFWVVCVVIVLIMVRYFRKKDWL